MRTVTTTVYKFEELTETAKQKAVEKMYDLNVDYDWWSSTYDDAENVGLKITSFGCDRRNIEIEFTGTPLDTYKEIFKDHGKETETYTLALAYVRDRNTISLEEVKRLCQAEADQLCECFDYVRGAYDVEQDYFDESVTEGIDAEFLRDLGNEYLSMLSKEYDWLTSEGAIVESILANEYEFTAEG